MSQLQLLVAVSIKVFLVDVSSTLVIVLFGDWVVSASIGLVDRPGRLPDVRYIGWLGAELYQRLPSP